ncbi:MAG TPA: hypothetical protein VHB47_10230 [Thermoanaerobaculia bacterium]|nr:hypothetical protein [Thermoanaerobaculia bacterium]
MADESKGLGDALASLGAALTSPAKLAFAGYVILVALGVIKNVEAWHFFVATGIFLLVQIFHDDYWRKVLNDKADLKRDINLAQARRMGRLDAPEEVMGHIARHEALLQRLMSGQGRDRG